MAKATGLIFSLFDVASARQVPFGIPQYAAIKIATMKNTDDFRYEGKPSRATAKLTPFAVSKDEWDTKEDTGKSMKNALCAFQTVLDSYCCVMG